MLMGDPEQEKKDKELLAIEKIRLELVREEIVREREE
jgi:hypothetical protein